MARVPKTIEQARSNLESSIPLIPGRYQEGIQRGKWADAASSDQSEANFAARINQAIQAKSRQAGVRRVGDAAWRAGALDKGVARIGPGLSAALQKYQTNFGRVYTPVLQAVAGLPPRTIDPMGNIDKRLKPVVQAFVANKIRGKG